MSYNKRDSRIFLIFINAILMTLSALLLTQALPANATTAPLGGCQCTDYVYSQRPDIARKMGNAKDWINSARKRGYPHDHVPQVGDVAVFLNGSHGFNATLGHVAMVTWVNDSHTQYNIAGWDGDNPTCILISYSNLTIKPDDWFIHNIGSKPATPQPPSSLPSTGGIQFNPVSPAQAGQTVTISANIQPGTDFRAARLLIDYKVVSESSADKFSYSWNTLSFLPSVHNIRLEIASQDDANWVYPYYYETTYLLRVAAPPPNRSPNIPSSLSPVDGQTLTTNPQLCWKNNGDPDGDPSYTRTEVWGPQNWVSPWLDGDNPCWTPTYAMSGQYSWAVRARDDKGSESGSSPVWLVKIQSSVQPTNKLSENADLIGIWEGSFKAAAYNGRSKDTTYLTDGTKLRLEIMDSCSVSQLCLNLLTITPSSNPIPITDKILTKDDVPPEHFKNFDVTLINPTCFYDSVFYVTYCFSIIDNNSLKLVGAGNVGYAMVGILNRVGGESSNRNIDLTDPISVVKAINEGLINIDASILNMLFDSNSKIAAYGGMGNDPNGKWSCPTEDIEPYCYLTPNDFISEIPSHLSSPITCKFEYFQANELLGMEIKGWNPVWNYPNGASDTLEISLERKDQNDAHSQFVVIKINVNPMKGPGFYKTECP